MEFEELKARIDGSLMGMSRLRRQAAQYVLHHPSEVAVLSLRKLSMRARVSPATLFKLAGEMGFNSYNDMKAVFQNAVVQQTGYFSSGAFEFQNRIGAGNPNSLTFQVVKADLENIQETFSNDAGKRVARAAAVLTESRRIYVVGMRACYSIAHYISYSIGLFRDEVHLLNDASGSMGEAIARMNNSDVLIAIGFFPYIRLTVDTVKHAIRSGAKVISITDSEASPLLSRSGEAFIFANNSPWIFGSITSAMVLSQCLVAAMVGIGGKNVLNEITKTERHLTRLKVFSK